MDERANVSSWNDEAQEFSLKGGETLKIGRVKFFVKEVSVSEDEIRTEDDSFEGLEEIKEEESVEHTLKNRATQIINGSDEESGEPS